MMRGIIPPIVTPLRSRDELDVEGLERLVQHVLAGGVHGIFILGTTGEAPGLSYRLRRELIERTCRLVAGRVPVLVGITDTAFVEAVHMAQFAAESGAQALVLAPPYYFPNSQPELLEYVQHLAPELPLPLFLYNMPTHTKTIFEVETVRRAMDMPNIVGLKDSSANMVYFHQLIRLLPQRPQWSLLVGPEELLAESVLLGGHGGVCGGANLRPRLYVDLYEAAHARDFEHAAALHAEVIHLSTTLYRVGRHSSAIIKGLKCALRELGICDDFMAEPFHRFREEERERVRKVLAELKITA
ncbi:dihydrodipicolinate synthetase [Chthoniobacter flavus Ellin428]|uniref:Dihydrodipicolinate synthetase n=1 Tax=Chthoniobacter flavus Ellin428 TaxID=497964 RepID=B4D5G4_9BACT|nr:dihydrodipicolinate synthase family protein [Chthoniobacter flavus]EDY18369.1 dihydrodipicolinate synthetase [Chthoniobacter flavus Ellin428]TCO91391.1 4-hydroxy-tetrahydrodipicolinate synthase [Chthoniobacter flavus]